MATRPKTMTRPAMASEKSLLPGPALNAPAPVCGEFRASGGRNGDGAEQPQPGAEPPTGDLEDPSLEGLQILVVEDEFLLALEVEATLIGFGCSIAGPFAKLAKAMDAARSKPLDGAVLDINLNGEMVYPLAELLDQQGVPFVFLTGYVTSDIPERFRHFRRLQKPLHPQSLHGVFMDMRRAGELRRPT